jgi:NAD(P)-dependent dehydrogenase (short-subunit alcohol dehydrogenase family)
VLGQEKGQSSFLTLVIDEEMPVNWRRIPQNFPPAGVTSPLSRGKRMGTPEEIANAIMFISSDKASYIIGASLAVDGGMTAG